jgi:hypothetical protein
MRILRVIAFVCLPVAFACSSSTSTGVPALDGGNAGNDSGSPAPSDDGGTPKSDGGKDDASSKDAAADVVKEAEPEPKDVAGSSECDAYCAKVEECGSTCVPATDCKVPTGKCAASVRDYLDCQATSGQWYCGSSGFSVVHSCKYDASLCQ